MAEVQFDIVADVNEQSFNEAIQFARDTKQKLDPLTLLNYETNAAKLKVELDKVRQQLRKAKADNDRTLTLELELKTQRLSSNLTEAKRRLQNFRNTGDANLSRLQKKFNDVGNTAGRLGPVFSRLGGVLAAAFSVREIARVSDTFNELNNRLGQIAQGQELDIIRNKIFALADEARVPVDALASSFTRFELVNRQIGGTTEETFKIIDTLSKGLVTAGSSASEASSVMLQLAQAFGSGRLAGDEFRSVSENLPLILDILAEKLGVPRGELKELASQGLITSEVLKDALVGANDDINEAFGRTSTTIGQALTQAMNRFIKKFGELDNEVGITDKVVRGIDAITDALIKSIEFVIKYSKEIGFLITAIGLLIGARALLGLSRLLLTIIPLLKTVGIATGALTFSVNVLNGSVTALTVNFARLLPLMGLLGVAIGGLIGLWKLYEATIDAINAKDAAEKSIKNQVKTVNEGTKEIKGRIKELEKANEDLAKSNDKTAQTRIEANNKLIKADKLLAEAIGETNKVDTEKLNQSARLRREANKTLNSLKETGKENIVVADTVNSLNGEIKALQDKLNEAAIGSAEFKEIQKQLGIEQGKLDIALGKGTKTVKKNKEETERMAKAKKRAKDIDTAFGTSTKSVNTLIQDSSKLIKEYTDEIDDLRDEVLKLDEDLAGLNNERATTLGERNVEILERQKEITKEIADINSENLTSEDLDKRIALEKELKDIIAEKVLIESNATEEELKEAQRLAELSPTARFLEELEIKKQTLEEEKQARLTRIKELEIEKANEEEINKALIENKKELEVNFTDFLLKQNASRIKSTALLTAEINKQISRLRERNRLQGITASNSQASNTTNNNGNNVINVSNTINNSGDLNNAQNDIINAVHDAVNGQNK